MLFFDTEGCAYCKAFIKHSLNDAGIQADVRKYFDVVAIDMFSDVEVTDFSGRALAAKQLARKEGATVSPTIVFHGADGEFLFRAVGYYPPPRFRSVLDYVIGGHTADQDFRQYSSAGKPEAVSSAPSRVEEPLFEKAPYMLDRSLLEGQRPLVVLFEEAACEECRQFHAEVLSHEPVRELLGRYDAVRLDWSDARTPLLTPTGRQSNPAQWSSQLALSGVPALVFFDEGGTEVFRLESLVLRQRMERALLYVLEKAYARGMTYQQFTRDKTIEKLKAGRPANSAAD